jgi:retron-type reverse transcriptase
MPKRHGNLFDLTFTPEGLYQAYRLARRGKRKTWAVMDFERNLGANLADLHQGLHSGNYQPQPYRVFWVMHPKPREISAPAFRDVVVQHAIYAVINPIFDAGFVFDSYGCRTNKGTHKASDRAQHYLRQSQPHSFTLQLDVRRFYYSIDRSKLRDLLARKIKDKRYLDLMMVFTDHGEPLGLPIGNLLSQLYALIYLNPLDHYIKRTLKVKKYVRYVDDMILFDLDKPTAHSLLRLVREYLGVNLGLKLSRYSIAPTQRGVNFVGYRTWRKRRFVRKHSLHSFSRALRLGDTQSLQSRLGHAKRTSSYRHLSARVRHERPDLIKHLTMR